MSGSRAFRVNPWAEEDSHHTHRILHNLCSFGRKLFCGLLCPGRAWPCTNFPLYTHGTYWTSWPQTPPYPNTHFNFKGLGWGTSHGRPERQDCLSESVNGEGLFLASCGAFYSGRMLKHQEIRITVFLHMITSNLMVQCDLSNRYQNLESLGENNMKFSLCSYYNSETMTSMNRNWKEWKSVC